MSKTKRQKSRRMQNRLMFENRFYKGALNPRKYKRGDEMFKGVSERQIVETVGQFQPHFVTGEQRIEVARQRANAVYHGKVNNYKGGGLGKHIVHIKTMTDLQHQEKLARTKYYKVRNAVKGMNGEQFDRLFKSKFPREYALVYPT